MPVTRQPGTYQHKLLAGQRAASPARPMLPCDADRFSLWTLLPNRQALHTSSALLTLWWLPHANPGSVPYSWQGRARTRLHDGGGAEVDAAHVVLRARVVYGGVLGLEQEVLRLQVPVHHPPAPIQPSLDTAVALAGDPTICSMLRVHKKCMVASCDIRHSIITGKDIKVRSMLT